jgi:hypothetical protein
MKKRLSLDSLLALAAGPENAARTGAAVAERIGVWPTTVSNWRARGVPPARLEQIRQLCPNPPDWDRIQHLASCKIVLEAS